MRHNATQGSSYSPTMLSSPTDPHFDRRVLSVPSRAFFDSNTPWQHKVDDEKNEFISTIPHRYLPITNSTANMLFMFISYRSRTANEENEWYQMNYPLECICWKAVKGEILPGLRRGKLINTKSIDCPWSSVNRPGGIRASKWGSWISFALSAMKIRITVRVANATSYARESSERQILKSLPQCRKFHVTSFANGKYTVNLADRRKFVEDPLYLRSTRHLDLLLRSSHVIPIYDHTIIRWAVWRRTQSYDC